MKQFVVRKVVPVLFALWFVAFLVCGVMAEVKDDVTPAFQVFVIVQMPVFLMLLLLWAKEVFFRQLREENRENDLFD